jgi:hypothetical protein
MESFDRNSVAWLHVRLKIRAIYFWPGHHFLVTTTDFPDGLYAECYFVLIFHRIKGLSGFNWNNKRSPLLCTVTANMTDMISG